MSGLGRLLAPQRVAFIGSTSTPAGLGARTLRHLRAAGYQGSIAIAKAADVEPDTDVAVVAVPAAAAQQVVDDVAAKARHIIVYTSGFEEAGQPRLQLPPGSGARIIGPNSVGLYYRPTRTVLTFAAAFDDVNEEDCAGRTSGIFLISQSGAFGARLVQAARRYGVAVDGFAATGNETCYGACELAADLIESEHYRPRVLALYLESSRDGAALRRMLCLAAGHGVSLVLLAGGESTAGAAAARSHTAAVTPGYTALAALCARYGAVLTRSDRELTEAMIGLSLLGRHPAPPGQRSRAAVVTGSGGAGVVAADMLARREITLPPPSAALRGRLAALLPSYASVQNPVDVTAQVIGDTATLAEVCRVIASSGEVDSLLVVGRVGQAAELARAAGDLMPVVTCALDADPVTVAPSMQAGLAVLPGLEAACNVTRAVTAAPRAGRARAEGLAGPSGAPGGGDSPDAAGSLDLVAGAGIEVAPWQLASSVPEALRAGRELGWPVVIKANLPAGTHKAQHGGIRLDVWPGNAEQAARELLQVAPTLVVARQLRAGPELFAGVRRDPACGLMVAAGLGGGDVELAGRIVSVPADASQEWLRGRLALEVFQRGGPRYAALAALLAAAAAALASFAAHYDLALVECNPLVPAGDRLIALDARVISHD